MQNMSWVRQFRIYIPRQRGRGEDTLVGVTIQPPMTHPVTPALTVIWTRARGEPRNRQAHTLLRCPTGPSNINAPRMFEYVESERRAPKIKGSYTLRELKWPLTRREQEVKPPNWGLTPSWKPNWPLRWWWEWEESPQNQGVIHSQRA